MFAPSVITLPPHRGGQKLYRGGKKLIFRALGAVLNISLPLAKIYIPPLTMGAHTSSSNCSLSSFVRKGMKERKTDEIISI